MQQVFSDSGSGPELPEDQMDVVNDDFTTWAIENKKWVDIYLDYGQRQSVMNAILQASGQPRLHWKTVMENFIYHSGLQLSSRIFKLCRGHMAFTNWYSFSATHQTMDSNTCAICLSPMPQNVVQGIDTFYYIRLKPRLERMFLNENMCRDLYSYELNHEPGIWSDFHDGRCFQRILEKYGGFDQLENDIFIAVSTDGFQPFRSTDQDVWPILAIILNLPPSIRYKTANVIPLGFAPRPSPSNLQSFLAPLLHELRDDIGFDGSFFQFYDGLTRRVRVHIVWILGDLPVVAKLAGIQGHNARRPCRFCTISGVWSPKNRHYYYPSKVRQEDGSFIEKYNLSSPPTRTENDIETCYEVLSTVAGPELQSLRTETGIKEKSILFAIPTLEPFNSFPIDTMHLLYNVSREMLGLFISGMNDDGLISKGQLEFIDSSLSSMGIGISSTVAPTPSPLSKYKSWKAAEHKRFVLSYSSVVFENMMPAVYLNGWNQFVMFYDLVCRKTLKEVEVQEIGTLATSFLSFVEETIFRYDFNRLSICKYVFHLLLHVKDDVIQNGPPVCYSQFWVERYIGSLVARLNAKRLPATALYRASLFNEAAKIIYDNSFVRNTEITNEFTLRGSFRKVVLRDFDTQGLVKRALKYYFARKYAGISGDQCNDIVNAVKEINSYSRFSRGHEGREVRFRCCGSKHNVSLVQVEGHSDCSVAVHMNETEASAELYYGRIRNILRIQVDLNQLGQLVIHNDMQEFYDLIVVDWALNLEVGPHDQIRSIRARAASFTQMSVEDINIVQRKIIVAENNIPTRFSGRGNRTVVRSRRVCSFIDDKSREDYVLSSTKTNADEKNIVLRLH